MSQEKEKEASAEDSNTPAQEAITPSNDITTAIATTTTADDTKTTTTTETTNNNTNNTNTNKSRKRTKKKRKHNDKEEELLEAKQERYDKLLYTAKKQLTKQAKQVKMFLVQKSIRKVKEKTTSEVKQDQLSLWKDLPLELVVHQAIKQLGLLHANPNPNTVDTTTTTNDGKDDIYKSHIATILSHKRFQKGLEEWNEKVTDYRRWSLQLSDRNDRFDTDQDQNNQQRQPTSLFCSLNHNNGEGGDDAAAAPIFDASDKMASYGPAATMDGQPPKKKNRQGQRARKAKAQAKEAKKQGKQYQSINWRSSEGKSTKRPRDEKDDRDKPPPSAKPEAPAAPDHPSWAAKLQQKSGIVAFQGTKITF
jgi:hypothetical protein